MMRLSGDRPRMMVLACLVASVPACMAQGVVADNVSENTTDAGVTVDGVLIKDGEVDGRDVSADGAQLDTNTTAITDMATLDGSQTLTNKTLTDPVVNASGGSVTLPQGADVSGNVAEGQISWDFDDDKLYVGTGSAAQEIGGGGGGGTVVDTFGIAETQVSTGNNGYVIFGQKMKHGGTVISFQGYCEQASSARIRLLKNDSVVATVNLSTSTVVEDTSSISFNPGDVFKIDFDNATGFVYALSANVIVEYN